MNLKLKLTVVFLAVALATCFPAMAQTAAQAKTIDSRFSEVEKIRLHYLTAGNGPAVILLHGYAETSRMWRPLIPKLSGKFTVFAPDLPGIGESEIPKDGLDMKTAAIRIHTLVKSLGIAKARVVGHDIGLMVAYAYAAQFPAEVEKLVVMDAFLPGVPGWELAYNNPDLWHFRFHGPTPEALVQDREKIYFAYFWNDLAADKDHSLSESDRASYVAAYSRPGRMRAGWAYFASWPDTAKDFAQMAQTQLTMPVLSIAGEKASAAILGPQMKPGITHQPSHGDPLAAAVCRRRPDSFDRGRAGAGAQAAYFIREGQTDCGGDFAHEAQSRHPLECAIDGSGASYQSGDGAADLGRARPRAASHAEFPAFAR